MSIDTLTGDDFALLTRDEHDEALDLYDEAISKVFADATTLEVDVDRFAADRDKVGRLLTLRKVHQVRRDELADEAAPRPLAGQQYFDNELSELPS